MRNKTMTKVHGKNAVLFLDDAAGTCRNMTADLTNISLTRSKSLSETTTFGDGSAQREVDGIRDAGIDVSGIFNTTADVTAIVGMLDQMYSGSLWTRAQYLPAGSITGCPVYTASMALSNYAIAEPTDGVTTVQFSLQLASGSVVAACCV